MLNRIYKLLSVMINNAGLTNSDITCMGIGVQGLLNIDEGISLFSPNFSDWKNVPVVKWFEQKLHIPVFIDNDVRVNLYGEWYLGAGKGSKNVVLLTLELVLALGLLWMDMCCMEQQEVQAKSGM